MTDAPDPLVTLLAHFLFPGDPGGPHRVPREPETRFALLQRSAANAPERGMAFFDQIAVSSEFPHKTAIPLCWGVAQALEGLSPDSEGERRRVLTRFLVHALRSHAFLWEDGRAVAAVLEILAYQLLDLEDEEHLLSWQLRLSSHPDPSLIPQWEPYPGRDPAEGARAVLARSALATTARRVRAGEPPDPLRMALLVRLATDPHEAVRRALLSRLPELVHPGPAGDEPGKDLAWRLFSLACHGHVAECWDVSAPFLAGRYAHDPDRVRYWLRRRGLPGRGTPPSGKEIPEIWASGLALGLEAGIVTPERLAMDAASFADALTWAALLERLGELSRTAPTAEFRREAGETLLAVLDRVSFSPEVMTALRKSLEAATSDLTRAATGVPEDLVVNASPPGEARPRSRAVETIDLTCRIAYKLISVYDGSPGGAGLNWMFSWLAAVTPSAPLMTLRLCEALLSRMEMSPRFFQAMDGHRGTAALVRLLAGHPHPERAVMIQRAEALKNRW